VAGLLAACQGQNIREQIAVPGTSDLVKVQSVVQRSVYLDAVLVGDRMSGRFFFPAAGECLRLLEAQASVTYRRVGAWGEVSDADGHCEAVGIGGLGWWRDQQRKPRALGKMRKPARFQVIYTDEDYALARGDFPLAGAVRWPLSQDTIAVIPRNEACRQPLERGAAAMEYRASGPEALVLISPDGICEIEGFVQPVGRR
jgi:hypothetical protein